MPLCVVRYDRLQAFDDPEALGDDQGVVSDLLVCPELFVSAAPVGDGREALSLVECEGKIDIARAKHAKLRCFDDRDWFIIEAAQRASVANPR